MKLIVSTTGRTKPQYHDMSDVPDIDVPKVEGISYGRIMGDPKENRAYAYIELTPEQALGVALDILTKLHLDEGTIGNWSVQFPERKTELPTEALKATVAPRPEREPFDGGAAPVYEVPKWDRLSENGTYQLIKCGKAGIRYIHDEKHAAWIRREAKKRGLKASISLGNGIAHVRLTPAA